MFSYLDFRDLDLDGDLDRDEELDLSEYLLFFPFFS